MASRSRSAAARRAPPRRLEPEWLDELPAEDPRAIESRRDLARINAWMGHVGIMRRALSVHGRGRLPRSMLELGGGDGTFLLRLARSMVCEWPDLEVALVDRVDAVSGATQLALRDLGWALEVVRADVFALLDGGEPPAADVVIANLVLHHFDDAELERLFAVLARETDLFVACEPRRSALALGASRLLWALGCNEVSRHDAVASVRAGFRGRELSELWPVDGRWDLEERAAGPFTHVFAARRRAT